MTARVIRGISKRKASAPPRSPRIWLRGVSRGKGEPRLTINGEPAAFVLTESEADYILITREEYARILDRIDEREATAAYDRTRGEEIVPAEIVDRLLAGDNPVRVWREHRGMTLEQLGAAIGKRKGYLSEIESGKKTGTVETLRAIADVLRLDLDDVA
jgi:DNA-binding XRE family transcriptional regulator